MGVSTHTSTGAAAGAGTPAAGFRPPQRWSSGRVFLLAAVGSAVGLANIWRFPYVVGANGGGAFVIVYIVTMFLVTIPLLVTEIALGRRGGGDPVSTMKSLVGEAGASPAWRAYGWLSLFTTLTILSFYSVVAGWSLAYIPRIVDGILAADVVQIQAQYRQLTASPARMTFWHTAFMVLTVAVIARGLHRGIESAVTVLMPALFAILIGLVVYSAVVGDLPAALSYLFRPDFGSLSFDAVLMAVGSAFFSASVGVGAMMTYGAYLPESVSIWTVSIWTVVIDLLVALSAGLAMFPIVFANGLEPGSGPGLVFITLPVAFSQMPGGPLIGLAFFGLLFSASLTSAFSLLEPTVMWLSRRFGISRPAAAWSVGSLVWGAGLASVMSFNVWKDIHPLGGLQRFAGATIFDLLDILVTNLLLPAGAILIALFAGWCLGRERLAAQLLGPAQGPLFSVWFWLTRCIVPLALLAVFLGNIF